MLKLKPEFVFEPAFCSLPFTKLILNSWGEVSMCCHQLAQLGKLDDKIDIMDLWNSPVAKDIRDNILKNKLHPVCTSWNSCPFIVKEKIAGPVMMYKNVSHPTYLEICLPDQHCNVGGNKPTDKNPACIMCRRNFGIPQQEDMTEFLCSKAKSIMPYLRNLCVLGIAEPFWKDAIFKIYDLLEFQNHKDHIQFVTNTNGICLNDRMANRFFEKTNYSELSWSLDSATPITHEKIRRLDTFDLVVKNLKNWIKTRDSYGGVASHKVTIYNNINLLNVHEMTMMVEMVFELGVDKIIMLPTYDQAGSVLLGELLLCEKNVNIFKKCSEAAWKRAQELGVNLQYSKSFDILPPDVDYPLVQLS